jgi:FecR-like protein
MNMQTQVILTIASLAILFPNQVRADELKEAKVTQVIQDVKVLPSNASPRAAAVNDDVRPGTAVQTGVQSRSELTFKDKTITRLGEKTIFSVGEGARTIDLGSGQFLLYVPKKAGGAKVKMGPVTAAITGTTILGDYDPSGVTKLIVLEGGACLYLDSVGQSVFVGPGQGITYDPIYGRLGNPYDVDVNQVTTSPLIKDFRELPSAPYFRSTAQRQAATAAAVGDEGAVAAAVRAAGATSVATATPEQFMQGLGSLFARSTPAEVCAYVGVAVRARPDLATRIVASALTASRASQYSHTDFKDFKDFKQPVGKEIGCDEVICITQAAITAYPSAAKEIVEAAQAAVPLLAYCVTVPCPLSNAFVQPRVPTTINPNNFRTPPPVSPEQPVTGTDSDD